MKNNKNEKLRRQIKMNEWRAAFDQHQRSTEEQIGTIVSQMKGDREALSETTARVIALESTVESMLSHVRSIASDIKDLARAVNTPPPRFPVLQASLLAVSVLGLFGGAIAAYVSVATGHAEEVAMIRHESDQESTTAIMLELSDRIERIEKGE